MKDSICLSLSEGVGMSVAGGVVRPQGFLDQLLTHHTTRYAHSQGFPSFHSFALRSYSDGG